jgi:transposase
MLWFADEQRSDDEITCLLAVNRTTVHRVWKRSRERGLTPTFADQPRSGTPAKIDGRIATMLTMLACADPPEGYGRWTLPLLVEKLIAVGVGASIRTGELSRGPLGCTPAGCPAVAC